MTQVSENISFLSFIRNDVICILRDIFEVFANDIFSTGRYIMSGNQDGTVTVWDRLASPTPQLNADPILPPLFTFQAHDETVNGIRSAEHFI